MNIPSAVHQTLTYYLDELASGETDAAEAKRRILESFENQDLVIEHRESIRHGFVVSAERAAREWVAGPVIWGTKTVKGIKP